MIEKMKRAVRALASGVVIAVLPIGGMAIAPAVAQDAIPGLPDMGESYPLTSDLVIGWVESYPAVQTLGETLSEDLEVPEGEDPVAGLAALATVTGAVDQLNAVVQGYGFEDFSQWTNVMFSVVFSYSILEAPAEQQPMLIGMFNQTPENLEAVSAHADAIGELLDSL